MKFSLQTKKALILYITHFFTDCIKYTFELFSDTRARVRLTEQ